MNDQDKTKEPCLQETERQKTEEELRNNIARYRSLFDHAPISLWEKDFSAVRHYLADLRANGIADLAVWFGDHPESVAHCLQLIKVNRVNQATLSLFKAADRSELGADLGLLFDESSIDIFLNGLIALDRGETFFIGEITLKTLASEPLKTIMQVSIAPGYETDWGKVLVSVLDLTARVQAEEARRESENRFQIAFRTSPDSININRLSDGLYIDINEGFTALTGFTADEVIGHTSQEINIWADLQDRERLVKGLSATGSVRDLEASFRFKDGTVRTGLMSARIIQFGGELCILSITRDITERKLAEEAVRASEEKYRVLVENLPDFIVRFNTAAQILFANAQVLQGLESALGLKEVQVIGKTYRELGFPPDLCDFWEEKIRAVCESGQSYESEYVYESGYGTLVASWRLIPELDEHGKTKSILSLSRDITEQKRLEAESRKAAVLEAELKKEKEVIALKERFISTVSHEFRTPLSVIRTSSDLLNQYADKLSANRRHELLQLIDQQIMHMSDMIDDTLDLTRAQVGKMEFHPGPLDLERFCHALLNQIQLTYGTHHRFEFVSQAPGTPVMVDSRLLQHILTNLLSNAIKYAPSDTTIGLELDHNAHEVIFRVADAGIGIPESDHERLFEPFYRAENVGDIKGTGLGLAIVKQYVGLHGGRIEVASREGEGSVFSVFLPLIQG